MGVSLAPLTLRSSWTTTTLSQAQQFSTHLRQFSERGTLAAWHTVVGLLDRDIDRIRLGTTAAGLREKASRSRTEWDACSTQVESFWKTDG